MSKQLYVVMDSRALYDTEKATVLQSVGATRPKMEELQEVWGEMNAVLVRWYGCDGKGFTKTEIIGVIP